MYIHVSKPCPKTATIKKVKLITLAEINIEVFETEKPSSTNGQTEKEYTEEWSTEAVVNAPI